jgi:hypothetical protein
MTRRWPDAERVLPLGVMAVCVACSKDATRSEPAPLTVGPRVVPGLVSGAAPPTAPPPPSPVVATVDPVELQPDAVTYVVTEKRDASETRADPDLATVQAARVAGAGCFGSVQGGPDVRRALLTVTVVPSGTVSRVEVAGESDPGVVDCLRRVGNGLRFSSQESKQPTGETGGAQNGGGPSGSQRGEPTGAPSGSQTESIRSFSIDVSVARSH